LFEVGSDQMHPSNNEEGDEEEQEDEAEEKEKAGKVEYVNPISHIFSHILYHLAFYPSIIYYPLKIFMWILITSSNLKYKQQKYIYLV